MNTLAYLISQIIGSTIGYIIAINIIKHIEKRRMDKAYKELEEFKKGYKE